MRTVITLVVGQKFRWDGEQWTVVAMEGSLATIQSRGKRSMVLEIRELARRLPENELAEPWVEPEGIGHLLDNLPVDERNVLAERLRDVNEILTGFQSGDSSNPANDEPRIQYAPDQPMMSRYAAKADERSVHKNTVRRWVSRYRQDGVIGLLDERSYRSINPFGNVDIRWVDAARAVLSEHSDGSRPTKKIVVERINRRVKSTFRADEVKIPCRRTALKILDEISRGKADFTGATKQKRSIANRPHGTYGHLVATRPGEYLMVDTTPLDVFGLDRLTNRWTRCELTVAMDIYSRCITAVRLTPCSTKAIDAALLLYESITTGPVSPSSQSTLPYLGVPTLIEVDADRIESQDQGLPGVAAETLVVDHGKIYLSDHLFAVCDRLGISIQPARKRTPTDKGPVERWFRTLGEGLLGTLPGYKGPDVYSRGDAIEEEAFYTIDQLENIIRDWIIEVYHHRPHRGLCLPEVPGVDLSPIEAFKQGLARAGMLRIPQSPNLALDFLPVKWRTIQHYGVDIKGLRFNAECLDHHRNATSPFGGLNAGKWPFRYDPDDLSTLYFQDPRTNEWNEVPWVRRSELGLPFSEEALLYAREISKQDDLPFDEIAALSNLLHRWDAGLHQNVAERRMAIRSDVKRRSLNSSRFQVVNDRPPIAVQRALSPSDDSRAYDDEESEDDYLDESLEDFYDEAMETM